MSIIAPDIPCLALIIKKTGSSLCLTRVRASPCTHLWLHALYPLCFSFFRSWSSAAAAAAAAGCWIKLQETDSGSRCHFFILLRFPSFLPSFLPSTHTLTHSSGVSVPLRPSLLRLVALFEHRHHSTSAARALPKRARAGNLCLHAQIERQRKM